MSKMLPIQDPIGFFRQLFRALRMVRQIAPAWTWINSTIAILQGVLPVASLYVMKRLLDSIAIALGDSSLPAPTNSFMVWILIAAGISLFTAAIRSVGEFSAETLSLWVTDAVADILHAQSIAVDLEYYEDPQYFDTLHRAQQEAPYRPTQIINGLIQIARSLISLLGIIGLLVSFNWLLTLALMLAALPGAFLRLYYSRQSFRFVQAQTQKERVAWYYHNILTYSDYAQELRLFDLGTLFKSRFQDTRQQIRAGKLFLTRRRIFMDLLAQGLSIIALFGSLTWIAFETVHGRLSIGDLVIYYLAFQNSLSYLQGLLRSLAGLYEDNLFLTNLFKFLDLKPKIQSPAKPLSVPQPLPGLVEFSNISFTYPGHQNQALHNINIRLSPGEVIALVGQNGSGKTTLIKLLCRLYDPTQGAILINGMDIRSLDPKHWRRLISVNFQNFVHYNLSASENIWLGDIETPPLPEDILKASQLSGADSIISRLSFGYNTILGQWFEGGQELSGGEWQKIALARAFWRKAKIIILDEPTSSLDPLAESKLFSNFRQSLHGRSAILISHRFSTVQMADCIYVLDQGRIIEHGSHRDLLSKNGHYASLYNAQAQYYTHE